METEAKSNGDDVVKEGGDGREEGEGVVQKLSFTRWLYVLDCPNPRSTPLLQGVSLLEGNSSSTDSKIEEGGEGPQEGKGKAIVSKKHAIVIMGTDFLDCPVCSNPLSPPIFQCSLGHFVCSSCRDKLPGSERACGVCSKPVLDRCHGVERLVGSVLVPCSYHVHGCTGVIPYHQKAEHEEACPHAPCFCPVKGCGFTGTTAALLDHFTAQHKWPMTAFKYFEPFDVPVKVGMHVLHGSAEDKDKDKDNDSDLFLLQVGSPDSPLHTVSLVRVQAHAQEYTVACSVGFSWFRGQYQVATLEVIRSSSLSDGLPICCFCIIPKVSRGGRRPVVLSVTIGIDAEDDEDGNEEGGADDCHSEVDDGKKDDKGDGHNGD